jgi:hypothetical protein
MLLYLGLARSGLAKPFEDVIDKFRLALRHSVFETITGGFDQGLFPVIEGWGARYRFSPRDPSAAVKIIPGPEPSRIGARRERLSGLAWSEIDSILAQADHLFEWDSAIFKIHQELRRHGLVAVGRRHSRGLSINEPLERVFGQPAHQQPDLSGEQFLPDRMYGEMRSLDAANMLSQFQQGYEVRAVAGFHDTAFRIGTTFSSFASIATLKSRQRAALVQPQPCELSTTKSARRRLS